MAYPAELLNDGETIHLDLHPHWSTLVASALVPAAALTVTVVLVSENWLHGLVGSLVGCAWIAVLVWIGWRLAKYFTTEFVVTSSRVVYQQGLLSKRGTEIPLDRITNTSTSRKPLERLLGNGDLIIESAGMNSQARFDDIANTAQVQKLIHRLVEERSTVVRGGTVSGPGLAEQLERLAALHQNGSLSDEEFQAAKATLMHD